LATERAEAADTGSRAEIERPDNPPGENLPRDNPLARSPMALVQFGPYTSIQVNVGVLGNNVTGDAANEPSIAVNPLNPMNMVIGWRQFATVTSNFREAGWAYTFDGGHTWTAGVLQGGIFRSDPVLDVDSHGTFYYQSLRLGQYSPLEDVFRSSDGGVTWTTPISAFGGDKNWIAVDRTGGASDGQIYGIWQPEGACCGLNLLTRSTNGGASYESPVPVAGSPGLGILAVGPSGEVYATGVEGTAGLDFNHFVVAKSVDAGNPLATPTFAGGRVNLAGSLKANIGSTSGPNPGGAVGQANVAVDASAGASRGNVYVSSSVGTAGLNDPTDVSFIRSTDGGTTWSSPVRVNDDPSPANWQWFAAHAVAPNGRIDMIWNDTRNTGQPNLSQLFYAYSWDGGATWSANVAVSPVFDTSVGYPQQDKIGDYPSIVSNDAGADVAYAATFNNEEDIYYVRVFPDCNGNGVSDVTDIANATSQDCDGNHVPDECQTGVICGPSLSYASSASSDSCSAGGAASGDGSVDPGEDVILTVSLVNDGTVSLTNVAATLATSTPGVTVTRASAAYPNIPAHGIATSNPPNFAFTVGTRVPCGTALTFTITGSADQGSWTRAFEVPVGLRGSTTQVFNSTDVPKTIVAPRVTSTLSVADPSAVLHVSVGVTILHSPTVDLVLTLVGPNGARVLLANAEGGAGANYTGTMFDDGADVGVWNGTAPFSGSFKPAQPLSTLDGIPANGTWGLEVEDNGSIGKVMAWSLTQTLAGGFVCNSCGVSSPTLEPVSVSWSPGSTTALQWEAIPGATFYNVYRGTPADLPNLLSSTADSCRRATTTNSTTDGVLTEVPPVGSFYWYLVRAANGAGEGPAGNTTTGPRSQESSGDCP
jgi:subtilisin-like proprotein convertase family protein